MDAIRLFEGSIDLNSWRNGSDERLKLNQAFAAVRANSQLARCIRLVDDERISVEEFFNIISGEVWFDAWSEGPFTLKDVQMAVEMREASPHAFHLVSRPTLTYHALFTD